MNYWIIKKPNMNVGKAKIPQGQIYGLFSSYISINVNYC